MTKTYLSSCLTGDYGQRSSNHLQLLYELYSNTIEVSVYCVDNNYILTNNQSHWYSNLDGITNELIYSGPYHFSVISIPISIPVPGFDTCLTSSRYRRLSSIQASRLIALQTILNIHDNDDLSSLEEKWTSAKVLSAMVVPDNFYIAREKVFCCDIPDCGKLLCKQHEWGVK